MLNIKKNAQVGELKQIIGACMYIGYCTMSVVILEDI
jgi:hypothetical protein